MQVLQPDLGQLGLCLMIIQIKEVKYNYAGYN